jgi:hypothetical protein
MLSGISNAGGVIDELMDDVALFSDKPHVLISALDDANENIWTIDAESAVPWGETVPGCYRCGGRCR